MVKLKCYTKKILADISYVFTSLFYDIIGVVLLTALIDMLIIFPTAMYFIVIGNEISDFYLLWAGIALILSLVGAMILTIFKYLYSVKEYCDSYDKS